jgi:hypothetical protein
MHPGGTEALIDRKWTADADLYVEHGARPAEGRYETEVAREAWSVSRRKYGPTRSEIDKEVEDRSSLSEIKKRAEVSDFPIFSQ